MKPRVYKFGGASLENVEKLKDVAAFLKNERSVHPGPILAVVSAMGKTTDELIKLASEVNLQPQRRELDMLLSVGERISMSLLSLALQNLGETAISFTGSQSGIITDTSHGNARIIDIRPFRVEAHLQKNEIVVLAGFQGVSQATKEITTLGRGGTDTTAVAMASYFKCDFCDFKKDVGGLFSADPKLIPQARHLPHLHHRHLIDMTFWGAKVLHHRAAVLASQLGLSLHFSHFSNKTTTATKNTSTVVSGEIPMFEQHKILAINSHNLITEWKRAGSTTEALQKLQQLVDAGQIVYPQIISTETQGTTSVIYAVGSLQALQKNDPTSQLTEWSSATLTSHGSTHPELLALCLKNLNGISVKKILQDSTNLTFIVPQTQREEAISRLHKNVQD